MRRRELDRTHEKVIQGGRQSLCTKLGCSCEHSGVQLEHPQQRPTSAWSPGAGDRWGRAGTEFELYLWLQKANALFCWFAFPVNVCSYSLFTSRNTEQKHRPKSGQKKQPNRHLFQFPFHAPFPKPNSYFAQSLYFYVFFFFLITEVYVPKSNRKRSHSYGAAWERCLSHGKTQCASQNPMAFPERDGKAGSCVSQCRGFCILGVLRASWRAEAWQAAVGGLHHSCGFYAEDEGASEITAVPGSRMHRVISQL